MVDGSVEAVDRGQTESNRVLVRSFVDTVLVVGQLDRLADFIDADAFADHNLRLADDVAAATGCVGANA